MVFTEINGSTVSESDDISLFLRQLLHRSMQSSSISISPSISSISTSSPAIMTTHLASPTSSSLPEGMSDNLRIPCRSAIFSSLGRLAVDRISLAGSSGALNTSSGVVFSSSSSCFPVKGGSTVPSSPVGPVESESLSGTVQLRSFDNDTEEYDCESEEGPETAEEVQLKRQPPRNPSKRSRAAEVHNLSEKRRRSRINEKMKALQNLIPNSNKTDKASMLDEAIEYLKQLQLQVQMLSMRNGFALHPMCVPGIQGVRNPVQLSQMGMEFDGADVSLLTNFTSTLPMNQETLHSIFDLPNQYDPLPMASIPDISGTINPEASFGLEPSSQVPVGSFDPPPSSETIVLFLARFLPSNMEMEELLAIAGLKMVHSESNM
ncbi:hypothetical protein Nepgr_016638 [Nepenthes gracilis]|uniref:BHLH domain-containing protein n=1 Tax=Nepenthes gracilis TaxID=150966 RepID=A0AAD3SPN5_NEPGR|nr:hypothetical protein Nepgr_016638 [Nepenthes gracilis]